MEIANRLDMRASELLEEARRFQSAAGQPGCHVDAHDALASLEEAHQMLSAAWYQLAAGATPGTTGLSREQEVRLMGAMHDVAAAFAGSARACREGRSAVTPILAGESVVGHGRWVSNEGRIRSHTHG